MLNLLREWPMSVNIKFNHIEQTEQISEMVEGALSDLIKITDDRYRFNVKLSKEQDGYHVNINCSYHNKPIISKAANENLPKALSESVHAMRTQIIRKSDKIRNN